MKDKLVVVTDLGTLKAYKLENNHLNSHPRLELLESVDTDAEKKLSEQLTDQAGRFPRGSAKANGHTGDMSAGERHNIGLELKKRAIKQLAREINTLIRRNNFEGCYFAAGKEINQQILDELEPSARSKIEKNIPSNLTKVDKADLLSHF